MRNTVISSFLLPASALALTATASAQILAFNGPSPNIPAAAVDFDSPLIPSGPVPANVYMGTGITSVTQIGAGWTAAGDVLSAGIHNGQCLVSQGGVPMIAGAGEALDNLTAGDGWDIVLDNPVDEFQCGFPDQSGQPYDVELFLGATSLGVGNFAYGIGAPNLVYFRDANSQFDRVVITSPGASGGFGLDDLGFGNGPCTACPPPLTSNCVETLFASNNAGNVGGAIYFDLTVTQPVSFSGLMTNTGVAPGSPVGLEVYTTPMTYVGNAGNPAAWTLVASDDGTSVSAGDDVRTDITFLAPFMLTPGTYGIALIGNNQMTGLQLDHQYTNGTGTNQNYSSADGILSLSLGAADNTPFAGGGFTPRVWNGQLCHGLGQPGVNYCGPANANSTGASASMSASGSASVMANDLVLEAGGLPNAAFGFFLTSRTQGLTLNPGGSMGDLCLGGQIGRFVGPGQIQNSGATGMISLAVDNSQQPTPNGLVQIAMGETWNFQAWFRDAISGVATSNFTDGYEITFIN